MLRLAAVGLISHSLVESSALTGIMARASAVDYDHRLSGEEFYSQIRFQVITGYKGDSLDR